MTKSKLFQVRIEPDQLDQLQQGCREDSAKHGRDISASERIRDLIAKDNARRAKLRAKSTAGKKPNTTKRK